MNVLILTLKMLKRELAQLNDVVKQLMEQDRLKGAEDNLVVKGKSRCW